LITIYNKLTITHLERWSNYCWYHRDCCYGNQHLSTFASEAVCTTFWHSALSTQLGLLCCFLPTDFWWRSVRPCLFIYLVVRSYFRNFFLRYGVCVVSQWRRDKFSRVIRRLLVQWCNATAA